MEGLNKLKLLISKKYISVVLFIVLDIVFLVFISFLGYKIYGVYSEIQTLKTEIDQLRSSSLLIKNNKDLLEDNIGEYNTVLDSIIPDTETYFQVISAFEQLEAKTGVNIESYSINLLETTEDKMSLSLTITGTKESIETLFENYHYFGGRLITNEKLDFTPEGLGSMTFPVNLFHAATDESTTGNSGSNVISSEDIEFIQQIADKL